MKQMVFFSKKNQHYLKIELMSIFVTKVNVLSQIYAQIVHSDLWSVLSLTERTVSGYYHILKLLNYNHMYKLISYVSKTLWKLNLIRHLNQLVIQVRLNSRKRFNTADQEKIVIKHSDIKMIVLLSIQTAFKGLQFRSYFTYSFAEIIIRSIFLMLLALTKRKYEGSLNLV